MFFILVCVTRIVRGITGIINIFEMVPMVSHLINGENCFVFRYSNEELKWEK